MIGRLAIRVTSHVVAILRANGGAATVGLALLVPTLLMMLVGAVDFGLIVHEKIQLGQAARAGARYALISKPMDQADLTKIEVAILDTIDPVANPTRAVTAALFCECSGSAVACSDSTCTGGGPLDKYISVAVQEDVEILFGYPIIGKSFHLSRDTVLRLQ